MLIRQENEKDFNDVYFVIKSAFSSAEHSDGKEQDLVNALRKSDSFIPKLSLVAEIDNKVVGHILFIEAKVSDQTVLALAPLAILPEYQNQGIGSALIKEGHKIAKELGYEYSIVLGSEKYYPRFGYVPSNKLGIEVPEGIPSINFMAIKLKEDAKPISGAVTYAKEFGI